METFHSKNRSAVTLGKFDGLHRGHQKLVKKVAQLGRLDDINSIVCAFDMSPLWERLSVSKQILMTKTEREKKLEGCVDYLVDCPFTEVLAKMEAEDFIKEVLVHTFHAAYVVVGTDFHFGFNKRGDIHMLQAYESKYGYELIVVEKERYEDREISSTFVKEALNNGHMKFVETLLGYPYCIIGNVEHGKKLGRTLGFPTFNVPIPTEKMMPPNGVYMDRICVDEIWYPAIGNIGIKPTVTEGKRKLIESFLFGYSGDAYGKEVIIELYDYCREERKFKDLEALKKQVQKDVNYGKIFFGITE